MSNDNHDDLSRDVEPELITAYALGQLEDDELARVEALLAAGDEAAEREIATMRTLAGFVSDARAAEPMPALASDLRHRIQEELAEGRCGLPGRTSEAASDVVHGQGPARQAGPTEPVTIAASKKPWWRRSTFEVCVIGGICCALLALLLLPAVQGAREASRRMQASNKLHNLGTPLQNYHDSFSQPPAAAPAVTRSMADEQVVPETAKLAGPVDAGISQPGRFQRSIHQGEALSGRGQAQREGQGGYERMKSANDNLPPGALGGTGFIGQSSANNAQNTYASGSAARGKQNFDVLRRLMEAAKAQGQNNAEIEVAENAIKVSRGDLDSNDEIRRSRGVSESEARKYMFQLGDAERLTGPSDPGRVLGPQASLPAAEYYSDLYPALSDGELAKLRAQARERAALEAEKRRTVLEFDSAKATTIETMRQRSKLGEDPGTEQYAPIIENKFLSPLQQPLSTFSIDVDTASYANVRRFLNEGRLPPASSVRIEELVNYFRYDYPAPNSGIAGETPAPQGLAGQRPTPRGEPFSVNMEVAQCPWALTPALSQGEREGKRGHLLLRVGLKGKDVHRSERPASNLVFLLDVSGSMADQNKLPLLKTAMKLLVRELGENDKVSIVTYAGEAGLKLKPTRGHEQAKINRVIDGLSAGGSTNGSAGIELAYEQATAGFIKDGANRVILCTDGDLNVGITSDEALVKLIKKKAAGGTFLTVLGFGEGNLKDAKMEKLADNGNGLYAYIDSVREAKKVLVEQLTGSTITIAKDVKIQIEFNPREIASYRLLGYENRVMAAQDFNNDKKDAGEIGAGHTVTALYELVPAEAAQEAETKPQGVDPLKYQSESSKFKVQSSKSAGGSATLNAEPGSLNSAADSGELLTLKLRYKEPDGQTSKLVEYPLNERGHSFHSASADFQFAAAVASFGMILRGSEHRGSSNLAAVAEIASAAIGKDEGGYRAEFVDLVRKAQQLGGR